MKLQKMTDFVLEQKNPNANINEMISEYQKVINYAKFLKHPLTLGMLVPCDGEGNPIKKIEWVDSDSPVKHDNNNSLVHYLEKLCLFKNCKVNRSYYDEFDNPLHIISFKNGKNITIGCSVKLTIEDLIEYDLQLTESALKQIGINDTSNSSD